MKLWVKISLITLLLMTAAMAICNTILVISNKEKELSRLIDNAQTEHALFCTYFEQHVADNMSDNLSLTTQKSIIKYVFTNYAVHYSSGAQLVLVNVQESIYNETPYNPVIQSGLSDSDTTQYNITTIDNSDILFVAKRFQIVNEIYTVYLVQDVTNIFNGIAAFSRQTIIINIIVITAAAIVLLLLVHHSMRPLKDLEYNSELIAQGVYDKRIELSSNNEIGKVAKSFNQMAAAIEIKINELKAASEKLERIAEQQKIFIANLTHELKTPMTSIVGYSDALLSFHMDEGQREKALRFLNNECKRLEQLSQKLMQILITENQELALCQNSVALLFEKVKLALQIPLENKQIELVMYSEVDYFEMDIDLMVSAIANIVDNAINASEQGASITLKAYRDKQNIIIIIQDYGKGIEQERLDMVMIPFYRGSSDRKKPGAGLGLALAQTIIALHNGEMMLASKLGEGTKVKIVFKERF